MNWSYNQLQKQFIKILILDILTWMPGVSPALPPAKCCLEFQIT